MRKQLSKPEAVAAMDAYLDCVRVACHEIVLKKPNDAAFLPPKLIIEKAIALLEEFCAEQMSKIHN